MLLRRFAFCQDPLCSREGGLVGVQTSFNGLLDDEKLLSFELRYSSRLSKAGASLKSAKLNRVEISAKLA